MNARQPTRRQELIGVTTLLRFMARRDRVRVPVWFVAVVGVVTASASSVVGVYDRPDELADYAEIALADPALKAIAGPGYGLDTPTQGAVVMNEAGLYTLIAIALMCVFLTIRHTRAEEETDRAELVRAAPVGRAATLAAASVWVTLTNLAVSAGVTLGLVTIGLPVVGSVAFGAACTGLGLLFTGIAAIAAQIASSARSATAGSSGALGVFFVLRAIGDVGTEWMTWLSPLGWAQAIRPYSDERWWVLIPLAVATIGPAAVAVFLVGRRDLGAGLFEQRPGPARASTRLATPVALAARLQRTALLGWVVGVSIFGFFFGLVVDQADELLANPTIAEAFAASGSGTPTEMFLATTVLVLALTASGFAVSSVLRMRTEELGFRADPILAAPVSRRRWMLSQLAVAGGGSAAIMVASGLLTGVGHASQIGDIGEILPVIGASIAMVPALLVLVALVAALIGVSPAWSPVAWASVAFVAVVGLLSETLQLPQWVRNGSPFEHVPAVPAAAFEVLPVLLLLVIASGFAAIGVVTIERRDIASG